MPVMGGAEATLAITAEFPEARIIVLTTYDRKADIERPLKAGARGYLHQGMRYALRWPMPFEPRT